MMFLPASGEYKWSDFIWRCVGLFAKRATALDAGATDCSVHDWRGHGWIWTDLASSTPPNTRKWDAVLRGRRNHPRGVSRAVQLLSVAVADCDLVQSSSLVRRVTCKFKASKRKCCLLSNAYLEIPKPSWINYPQRFNSEVLPIFLYFFVAEKHLSSCLGDRWCFVLCYF